MELKTCPHCNADYYGSAGGECGSYACIAARRRSQRDARKDPTARHRDRPAVTAGQARGRKVERKEATRRGVRAQPGSGNQDHRPGDMVDGDELIEMKATLADSFRITAALWEKLRQEALLLGKKPVLVLDINGLRLEVRPG